MPERKEPGINGANYAMFTGFGLIVIGLFFLNVKPVIGSAVCAIGAVCFIGGLALKVLGPRE
jgi:uncharacterized membrane protein YgdD (TMEM256/DUF423 family)